MKILHFAIISIMILSIFAVISVLPQRAAGFQYSDEGNYPLIDVPKIMSIAENSTDFIEKTDRYDHYSLAKATLRPIPEKTGNTTEEYDLVYALYRNHNDCYWNNLLEVTLNDILNVTGTKEYSLNNEPAGYPQPPVSCPMNLEPSKMDYNPLLIILPPSPFATVNETFNASSGGPIVFSGTVHKLFSRYITLAVFDPNGELVATSQPQPEPDGTFSQTFQPFSPLWSMTGNYTVSITSGPHNLVESPFYFEGIGCCMTESPLHYADQGLPPLEQWKSYVPVRNTICAKGLQLVIKAEDGSPACVKPETAQKLTERGWAKQENFGANPITEIKIVGLQQTYNVGQPIVVSVSYTGYINSGIDPDVKIIDSNGTQVWDSCCFTHTESTIPYFHTAIFNVQGPRLANGFANAGYPVLNKTGSYTMVVSLEGTTTKASFAVSGTNNQTSSKPTLFLTTESPVVNIGHAVEIDIGLNNTSTSTLTVGSQDKWPLKTGGSLRLCMPMPFGAILFEGNYDTNNMTQAKPLYIVPQWQTIHCNDYQNYMAHTFVFQPLSDNSILEMYGGNFIAEMKYHLSLYGIYDNTTFEQFKEGAYTIVGMDEWGDHAIKHFVVTNSTGN